MPQESSAVADLVSLAHREPIHTSPDPQQPPGGPGFSASWILLIGVVVIGASVVVGYLMARQETPAGPEAAADLPPTTPKSTTPRAAAEPETDEEEIEPEPATALSEVDIELAKQTGFDVLVEPNGAMVTLDGQAIGAAPLRVRNLLPGAHAIDIEGPDGYFGKHLEFDLVAGDAEVLNLVLESVAGSAASDDEPIATVGSEGGSKADDNKRESESGDNATPGESEQKTSIAQERKRKGARDRKRRFKASADEEEILNKAAQVALGTLMLGAKPPCDIIINGKKTGLVTPQRAIQLPAGMHRIVLVNKKHEIRKSFKVKIKSGRTTRAIQDLSKEL